MACIFLKRYSCKCQTHTLISSPSNGFTSISWAGKVIRTCEWPLKEHTLFNPKFNSPTARSSVSFEQKWAVSVLLALHYSTTVLISQISVKSFLFKFTVFILKVSWVSGFKYGPLHCRVQRHRSQEFYSPFTPPYCISTPNQIWRYMLRFHPEARG